MKPLKISIAALLTILIAAGAFWGYQAVFSEPTLASGPLVAALKQAREPKQARQNLDAVYDSHIANTLPIDERLPMLEAEGFRCRINTSDLIEGNRFLTCQRPLEGEGFCEGFSYYVYETAAGEIMDRTGTDYYVEPRSRDWNGRCSANEERYYASSH